MTRLICRKWGYFYDENRQPIDGYFSVTVLSEEEIPEDAEGEKVLDIDISGLRLAFGDHVSLHVLVGKDMYVPLSEKMTISCLTSLMFREIQPEDVPEDFFKRLKESCDRLRRFADG